MNKLLLTVLAISLLTGCEKKDEVICIADSGGNRTLTIKLQKEGAPYVSIATAKAKAFVAFEEFDVPGFSDSSYDLVKFAEDNDDFVRFSGITCGIYYCKLRVIDNITGKTYTGSRIVTIDEETLNAESTIDMTLAP